MAGCVSFSRSFMLALAVLLPAVAGCVGIDPVSGPGPDVRLVDFDVVRRSAPESYKSFLRAVEIADEFIRPMPFFYEDFQGRVEASLSFDGDKLLLNGTPVYLCLGSPLITAANVAGAPLKFRAGAHASPGSIHFDFLDAPYNPHLVNILFYDVVLHGYRQKGNAYTISERLVHELTHVVQMKRLGISRFYLRYVWAFVFNVFNPVTYFGDEPGPYFRIGFEAEARKYERMLHNENVYRLDRLLLKRSPRR